MPATKIDLVRESRELYSPGREPVIVEVPEFPYLMIDGKGDPNTSTAYREAVEALYSVSYALKFMLKRGPRERDYRVMPLEGLWWVPDPSQFSVDRKGEWEWTMMIRQPEEVDAAMLGQAVRAAAGKKALPAAPRIRLERLAEGAAAQVLHVGPFAEEGPAIERLHTFIAERGYRLTGKHHEIYLSDPRRAAPERLKTVLRQPVLGAA